MRSVGIEELKDQASTIVNTGETVIIEKYGRPVGMYVPLGDNRGDKSSSYQLAEHIQRLMRTIAEQRGLTPDALADEIERWAAEEPQPT
jgi:antitoxin (DNA-binding transcriptional repressor) of toxin-antitoxin stability system